MSVSATFRQGPFAKLPPGIFLCVETRIGKQISRVSELSCSGNLFASHAEAPFQVEMNLTLNLEDEHIVTSQYS